MMYEVYKDVEKESILFFIQSELQFIISDKESEEFRNFEKLEKMLDKIKMYENIEEIDDFIIERGLNFESLSDERFLKDIINPFFENVKKSVFGFEKDEMEDARFFYEFEETTNLMFYIKDNFLS